MSLMFQMAVAQGLPTEREQAGLKGRVHTVKESEIEKIQRTDSIWKQFDTFRIGYTIKSVSKENPEVDTISENELRMIVKYAFRNMSVPDTIDDVTFRKLEKKMKRKMRKTLATIHVHSIDSVRVPKNATIEDTLFYSFTEYTTEGWLKSRRLVQNSGKGKMHEQTVATFDGGRKIEMRTYCQETGITRQWHYHYSDYEKDARLVAIVVTDNKKGEAGRVVERVLYEYQNNGETCYERHFNPSWRMLRERHYESGLLIDDNDYERNTIVHNLYDDAQLSITEVYDTSYKQLYTERYNYYTDYFKLRTVIDRYPPEEDGNNKIISSSEIIDDLDEKGNNWKSRKIEGQKVLNRTILYYTDDNRKKNNNKRLR